MKVKDLTFADTSPSEASVEKKLTNFERQQYLQQKRTALQADVNIIEGNQARMLRKLINNKIAFLGTPEMKAHDSPWIQLKFWISEVIRREFRFEPEQEGTYYIKNIPENRAIVNWFEEQRSRKHELYFQRDIISRRIKGLRNASVRARKVKVTYV